jgi:hypothetical protein
MSLVVDYVKAAIRNKIEMKVRVTPDGKMVRDEATDNLLQDIPVYVRQAVIDLQRSNLLPPREWNFAAIEQKQEQRDTNGDIRYNYIQLPVDFRELRELEIGGEHYQSDTGSVYFPFRYNKDGKKRYTILNVDNDTDELAKPRLILYPYPTDDIFVSLRYMIDGSETSLKLIDEKYNTAILRKVEEYIGLIDRATAQNEINDVVSQQMNMNGVSPLNGSPKQIKFSYFGRRI